ncbi:MAG: hypothetical protein Q9M16_09675 [Mariprofundus sp.]|nr:hypothetical protein [Mariprofundus sp.]
MIWSLQSLKPLLVACLHQPDRLFCYLKIPLSLVSAALLSFLAYQSWSYGEAYAIQHRVQLQLNVWYADAIKPDRALWLEQKKDIDRAIAYMPDNAAFHNMLALLYEFRAFQMERKGIHRDLQLIKARMQFRLAIKASPAWVYPWMNLANINSRIGQYDGEYVQAYERAIALGPWEKNTMPGLIELGLKAYVHLSKPEQQRVDNYIDRIAAGEGRWIGSLLKSRGTKPQVCQSLSTLQRKAAFEQICSNAHK